MAVHEKSYPIIPNIVKYLVTLIGKITHTKVESIILSDITQLKNQSNAIIFIIVDIFAHYEKRNNNYYVFINFSLLYNLKPIRSDRRAREWIKTKRKAFLRKINCYDMVLNHYWMQAENLREEVKQYKIPVHNFYTNTLVHKTGRTCDVNKTPWDIGFVGSLTPRRVKILNRLADYGLALSPHKGISVEEAVCKSEVVINIHALECAIAEIPRIIETLANGGCLITETSHGIEHYVPKHCYVESPYNELVYRAKQLLNNNRLVCEYRSAAVNYMHNKYNSNCIRSWRTILADIVKESGTSLQTTH